MHTPQELADLFDWTYQIIHMQAKGLSHEASVLQLPFRGNCFNWVVGHLVQHRDVVLKALGQSPLLTEAQKEMYKRGSAPLTDGATAVALPQLLRLLDESQKQITAVLQTLPVEAFDQIYREPSTLGESLRFLHWHETYHTGQLEILRQLAGTDDAII